MLVDIGVVQQNFGGDAADVQAGAAKKRVLFDYNGLQPEFAGANGRHVAARTAPDNRHIVLSHAHSPLPNPDCIG